MINKTNWVTYTGSDEQIDEISSSKNGFVCRNNETDSGILTIKYGQLFSDQSDYPILNAMWNGSLKRFVETNNTTHFWLIPDDPLRDMKIRQASTGQPVWIKTTPSYYWSRHAIKPGDTLAMYEPDPNINLVVIKTTTPDWNIPNAEYLLTEFEKSVDK